MAEQQNETTQANLFPRRVFHAHSVKVWIAIVAYALMGLYYLPSVFSTFIAPYWTLALLLPYLFYGLALLNELRIKGLLFASPANMGMHLPATLFWIALATQQLYRYAQTNDVRFLLFGIGYCLAALLALVSFVITSVGVWAFDRLARMTLVVHTNVSIMTLRELNSLLENLAVKIDVDKKELLSEELQASITLDLQSLEKLKALLDGL